MLQLGNRGTVTEASGFNPEEDAQKIYNAMKGAGKYLQNPFSVHLNNENHLVAF